MFKVIIIGLLGVFIWKRVDPANGTGGFTGIVFVPRLHEIFIPASWSKKFACIARPSLCEIYVLQYGVDEHAVNIS